MLQKKLTEFVHAHFFAALTFCVLNLVIVNHFTAPHICWRCFVPFVEMTEPHSDGCIECPVCWVDIRHDCFGVTHIHFGRIWKFWFWKKIHFNSLFNIILFANEKFKSPVATLNWCCSHAADLQFNQTFMSWEGTCFVNTMFMWKSFQCVNTI